MTVADPWNQSRRFV